MLMRTLKLIGLSLTMAVMVMLMMVMFAAAVPGWVKGLGGYSRLLCSSAYALAHGSCQVWDDDNDFVSFEGYPRWNGGVGLRRARVCKQTT